MSLEGQPKIFSLWLLPPAYQAQCGFRAQETARLARCQEAQDTAQEGGADETREAALCGHLSHEQVAVAREAPGLTCVQHEWA